MLWPPQCKKCTVNRYFYCGGGRRTRSLRAEAEGSLRLPCLAEGGVGEQFPTRTIHSARRSGAFLLMCAALLSDIEVAGRLLTDSIARDSKGSKWPPNRSRLMWPPIVLMGLDFRALMYWQRRVAASAPSVHQVPEYPGDFFFYCIPKFGVEQLVTFFRGRVRFGGLISLREVDSSALCRFAANFCSSILAHNF